MSRIDPADRRDRGFAMVALLVGMSISAIWMTAALPAWRQQAQRQKEEDLIFRGEQYARAIALYYVKNRNTYPPSIDALVEQRFLRKKWKDPITNKDFIPIGNGVGLPGSSQLPGSNPGIGQTPGRGSAPAAPAPGRGSPQIGAPGGGQGQTVGITGVRSESTATSIKIYQNQQTYNLWAFDASFAMARMGVGRGGGNQPGGNQPGRGNPADRGGGPGVQPGRGGPGAVPGRGGGGPVGPVGPGAPVGGRTGGSF